jgi:hypothetical protein
VTLVDAAGVWLLTEPDPSGLGELRYGHSRKVLRVLTIVGVTWRATDALVSSVDMAIKAQIAVRFVEVTALAIGIAEEFFRFLYIRRLAERIPDPIIVNRARVLQYYFPILIGLMMIVTSIPSTSAPGGPGGIACAVAILIPALIGLGIIMILLYLRLRSFLAAQLKIAEGFWSKNRHGGS